MMHIHEPDNRRIVAAVGGDRSCFCARPTGFVRAAVPTLPERVSDPHPALARTSGRYSSAGPILHPEVRPPHAQRMHKKIESIPTTAMRKLSVWHWPGNIRELENFIERSVILTRGTALFTELRPLFLTVCHRSPTSVEIAFEISRDHPAQDLSLPLKSAI
jgi:hypothetical protein